MAACARGWRCPGRCSSCCCGASSGAWTTTRSCGNCSDLWRMPEQTRRPWRAACRPDCCSWCAAICSPVLRSVGDCSVDALLATAAAAEYAEPLGRATGLPLCAGDAARPRRDGTLQPRRAQTRPRPRLPGQRHGWAQRPRIFFNDHLDDLPLMQVSQAVCWFGSDKTLAAARAAAPAVALRAVQGTDRGGDAADAGAHPAKPANGSASQQRVLCMVARVRTFS